MAHINKDRIKETTTTSGTGLFTLAGALAGYKAFSAPSSVSVMSRRNEVSAIDKPLSVAVVAKPLTLFVTRRPKRAAGG